MTFATAVKRGRKQTRPRIIEAAPELFWRDGALSR
jgi:AcrR family transcriptional regulator